MLACCDPEHHNGEGANILFLGGSVKFMREPQYSATIDQFKKDFAKKHGREPKIFAPR